MYQEEIMNKEREEMISRMILKMLIVRPGQSVIFIKFF